MCFTLFLCEFWWLRIQFKRLFPECVCDAVLTPPEVCLCLCFTSQPQLPPSPPSPPSAPPYLSPMEMHWGQGIWGEEHREAALHNLKGILMNQHSRTDYSHDNRPQTNSCIWSPLVLWLWKCWMCLCTCVWLFLFSKYSTSGLGECVWAPVHECVPLFLLRNWPGSWFTLMSPQEVVIIVCYDQKAPFFLFWCNFKLISLCIPSP